MLLSCAAALTLAAQAEPAPKSTDVAADVIIVSIGRVDRDQREVSAPVTVITREDIERLQGADLGDLLIAAPGVTIEGGERADALQPNIRGLGESRVVSRNDGARQNIAISHRGRSFLDPALVGRIELLRGPGSTLYGSGAVGGVLEVETLNPDQLGDGGEGLSGRLAARYAGNGDHGALTGAVGGQDGRFGALAALSVAQSDDFEDGDGQRVRFTGAETRTGLFKLVGEDVAGGEIRASYAAYLNDAPSLLTADRAEGDPVQRETRQDTAALTYTGAGQGWFKPDITLYAGETRFTETLLERDETRLNRLTTIGLDAVNVSRFTLGARPVALVSGIEIYRDAQDGRLNGTPNPGFAGSELTTLGAFVLAEAELTERLTATAGVRGDTIDLEADRAGLADSRLETASPNLALSYRLSDAFSVRAGYAEAFRAPSLRQLFVGGPHFPGNDYLPNPDLQPETARNLEAGLIWRAQALGGRFDGEVFVFRNEIDDFIEQVVAASTTRFLNVGEAVIEGVEGRLAYTGWLWDLSVSGQVLRGDNLERDEPLQSIPADEIAGQALRRFPALSLEAGGRLIATAAQDDVPGRPFTIASTPGHERVDLFAAWRSPDGRAVVRFGVDNLFDETYRRHLSEINAPGRSFKLSVQADF